MKFVASLFGLFSLTMVVAAVAALVAKQRLVPVEDEDGDEVHLVSIFGPMAFHSTVRANHCTGRTMNRS